MNNKTVIVIAAIIAFIIWLLSRKKGSGSPFGMQEKKDTKETPPDKNFTGGGGSFGGGGSSGSWLMNQNMAVQPTQVKSTPAQNSPVLLVEKKSPVGTAVPVVNPVPSIASPSKPPVIDLAKPSIKTAVMPTVIKAVEVPKMISDTPVLKAVNNTPVQTQNTSKPLDLGSKTPVAVSVPSPSVVPMEKLVSMTGGKTLNSRMVPVML